MYSLFSQIYQTENVLICFVFYVVRSEISLIMILHGGSCHAVMVLVFSVLFRLPLAMLRSNRLNMKRCPNLFHFCNIFDDFFSLNELLLLLNVTYLAFVYTLPRTKLARQCTLLVLIDFCPV